MEQLIIFAIIAIVSALFNKSQKKEEPKQMPPFNKDAKIQPPVELKVEERKTQRPPLTTQSFEDFAQKFLGNNQEEKALDDIDNQHVKPVLGRMVEQTPSYLAPPLIPTEASIERRIMPDVARKKEVQETSTNSTFKLPTSNQALMQAVIMAEVLGPPKAKRK